MSSTRPVSSAADVVFDERGLVPSIVIDASDGAVLMMAWMNAEALSRTLAGPSVTFWSRSREQLWVKGETSGNSLEVVSVSADCDADCLLVTARPAGPSCHTGARSCFFQPLADAAPLRLDEVLAPLARTARERQVDGDPATSWTARLLHEGPSLYGAKLREEAGELADACESESTERVASEAADLLYHLVVALTDRGVSLAQVASELRRREGRSGIDEKRSRPKP